MRAAAGLLTALLACLMAADPGFAQSRTRIWDVELGTPVAALPTEEFVDPSCGTNGGPPSLRLESFADFARCRAEPTTGLHEVWFIYDNEWEYIARAQRDDAAIATYSANTFYAQPIVTSYLVDDAGVVEGFRVFTDPRAPDDVRLHAYVLGGIFKTFFSTAAWTCSDLPAENGERPLEGLLLKQSCFSLDGDRLLKVETRHRYKPGQDLGVVPRDIIQAEGDFESSASLEVYRVDAVRGAPCCQALLSR
jgi:hypothetical protein